MTLTLQSSKIILLRIYQFLVKRFNKKMAKPKGVQAGSGNNDVKEVTASPLKSKQVQAGPSHRVGQGDSASDLLSTKKSETPLR